ncbi:MAG: TerB family tellurite resistance protein [Planctomycetaceae bacterium]|nr:TerB family tellurite resistance protein [Planctomycetaceae bacterium]
MMDDKANRDLHNVIVLSMLDGDLNDKECAFIEGLAARLGMDQGTLNDMCRQIRDGHKSISLPKNSAEAEMTVQMLAEAAAADGTVTPAERSLLHRICRHVGLDKQNADVVLDAILPGQSDDVSAADEEVNRQIEAMSQEIYADYVSWDASTRLAKLRAIAAHGAAAVIPLLRMLESYRVPDGLDDAMAFKALIVNELGSLGDERAIYYLAQQVNIGDVDDDITNSALRGTAAAAIGKIVGQPMAADAAGVAEARRWWRDAGRLKFDRLAY